MRLKTLLVVGVVLAAPVVSFAQGHGDHKEPAVPDEFVDFGVLAPATGIPGTGCATVGPGQPVIGGPADPCSYKLHNLTPEEVTVTKGGQVTFQVHGGGHAMAIYEVSKDTTRDELGQYLCAGVDPAEIELPSNHPCNLNATKANASHIVADGKGNVVIVADANTTNAHPLNRVWYEPGRLMSAGGRQFLPPGTTPAGPNSDGQLISYRFLQNGRYLVICINRVHFLNDWMFGFVNVTGN